jgi:uncharacterized repeat protein (TIGR02543 family)
MTKKSTGIIALIALVFGSVSLGISGATATPSETVTVTIKGFNGDSSLLTRPIKTRILALTSSYSTAASIACVGYIYNPGNSKPNTTLARQRAVKACNFVKSQIPNISITSTTGFTSTRKADQFRGVKIVLTLAPAALTTTYDFNGGTGSPASVEVSAGGTVTLPTPTRDGYSFTGWFSDAGLTTSVGAAGATYSPSASATLFAGWIANYTTTYDFNGGTGSPASVEVSAGGTVTLPTPTRDGYSFTGWFSDAGLTTSVGAAGATYSPSASATLFAGWTATSGITLVFNPIAAGQYMWYCGPGVEATVCSSSPNVTVSGTTATSRLVDPAAYDPSGSTFSITVRAPSPLPANYIIGPGVGVTCLMRATATIHGTANGYTSGDWTGSGAGWMHYWYTGCSLDSGVTSAYFYNEQR